MISKLNEIDGFLKNKKIYNIINFSLVGILLCLMIIRQESLGDMMKYLLSQGVFIYGQGYLLKSILKIDITRNMDFAISYAMGVGVIVFEYLFFMGIMGRVDFLNIGYILGIYGIIRKVTETKGEKVEWINNGVFTIASCLCILCFFSLYAKNSMPDVIGRIGMNQDVLWSIGNTQSLLRSFPPVDARMSGIPFVYHYFVNIYYAVCTAITGINPVRMYFVYGYIVKLFFVVAAVFAFGTTYLKGKYKGFAFTMIYFFTACASLSRAYGNGFGIFMNSNFKHLTDGAFGFELSMALMMSFFVILEKIINQEKSNYGNLIASILLFITLSGTKGPIGLMIILAIGSVCVFELVVFKRINKRLIKICCILSCVFIALFLVVLKSGSGDLNFELAYIAKDTLIGKKILGIFGSGILGKLILIPIHFVLYQPFASTMFIIWIAIKIMNIKKCSTEDLVFGAISLIGIICAYIMSHYGHSEIYFLMTAIPFMGIVAVELITDKRTIKGIKVLGICLLVVGFSTGIYIVKGRFDLGVKYYEIAKSKVEFSNGFHPNAITDDEYEGITWIRENTKEDSVILSDRYFISSKEVDRTARYFYYSALSQRQFYLEGYFYFYAPDKFRETIIEKKENAKMIYENSDGALAVKNDIDYVIISKGLYDSYKILNEKYFKNIFENKEITIYKVK